MDRKWGSERWNFMIQVDSPASGGWDDIIMCGGDFPCSEEHLKTFLNNELMGSVGVLNHSLHIQL